MNPLKQFCVILHYYFSGRRVKMRSDMREAMESENACSHSDRAVLSELPEL